MYVQASGPKINFVEKPTNFTYQNIEKYVIKHHKKEHSPYNVYHKFSKQNIRLLLTVSNGMWKMWKIAFAERTFNKTKISPSNTLFNKAK